MLVAAFAVFALLATSCNKYYDDGGLTSTEVLKMNSLEYMKTRPDIFDTTLMVLKMAGLESVIEKENVTFFLPQNKSITRALRNVNTYLKENKAKLDYTKDTVLLEDIKPAVWRKFMSRYIIKGAKLRSDIVPGKMKTTANVTTVTGGENMKTYDDFEMLVFLDRTAWENVAEAGPEIIYLADLRIDDPLKGTITAKVTSSNLRTTSGAVHVLSINHEFGFNSSNLFIPLK